MKIYEVKLFIWKIKLSGAIGNNVVDQMQLITKDLEHSNAILRQNENLRENFLFNWIINLSGGIIKGNYIEKILLDFKSR